MCCSHLLLWGGCIFADGFRARRRRLFSAEPPQVAPGQVITLFYRAVGPSNNGDLRSGRAQAPLPAMLAGLAAQMIQEKSLFNVPLIEVSQQNTCPPGLAGPACLLTAVRIQIPFDISADVSRDPQSGSVTLSPVANLVLYADGQPTADSLLQPVPDNSHVLTTCDSEGQTQAGTCGRMVFHPDGRLVSAGSPAVKTETVHVFLYGMGQTSPAATTGIAAQPGYFLTDVLGSPRVRISFTPFVNALVSAARHGDSSDPNEVPAAIIGATLKAGDVGIYELVITVPPSLPFTVACGGPVRSNYSLNVITSQGVEPVAVCIGQ